MQTRTIDPPGAAALQRQDGLLRLGAALREAGYRFVTATPASHARVNARSGNGEAKDLAGIFGWSRPFREPLLGAGMLDVMRAADILAPEGDLWRSRVRASSLGNELFFHSAFPTSETDSVFFGPDTYRFAAAIEAGLPYLAGPVRRAVDIGCGAGPGAILVAKAFPAAEVLAIDINEDALRLARVNARLAGVTNVACRRSDLLADVEGDFDLIVSNPPYLNDPLERSYRHGGGELGAALSLAILDAALGRLAPGGTLVLYTGVAIVGGHDPFRREAMAKLDRASWVGEYREVDPDVFGEELETRSYARADRIAAVTLKLTRPTGSRPTALRDQERLS